MAHPEPMPSRPDDDIIMEIIDLLEKHVLEKHAMDTVATLTIVMRETQDAAELTRLMQKWLASV